METQNLSFFFGIVMWLGLIVLQFCVAPIIIDWQLRAFGQTKWVSINKLPPHFKKSLLAICEQNRIPLPKMGIINDGSPQAFTYGRTPRSARVVFSQGMFELLDPEEAEAVLAHELGHIKHWDFVIMTLIKVVPTLLYIIYRKCKTMQESNRKQNIKGKQKADPTALAMVVSYILYLISEYLVLFVSRVREYHADRFSAFATKKPNKLLTALVKIAYGLLGSQPSKDSENSSSALKSKQDRLKGVEALNIMNVSRSKQLALASQGEGYHFNPQVIKDIMRWDLWSPWAFYYELHSTHPLTAKRIKALGAYALALQQEPFVRFQKEKPESYWDDFFSDLFVLCLPYVMGIGGLLAYAWSKDWNWDVISALFKEALVNKTSVSTGSIEIKIPAYPWGLLAGGALWFSIGAFLRLILTYPFKEFWPCSVASLLKVIKVSPVRSYSVSLEGHILGRGEAGDIFSEDFVLKDKTGIMYLNHEPFGLNILFALFRYDKFKGQKVTVTGWYRRSPAPYLEVRNIQTEKGIKSTAYTYNYKLAFCAIGILVPLLYYGFSM